MTFSQDQQNESYLPLYDTVPEKYEEMREFLIEQLRKISDVVNSREIGWYLDEELLTGKQFIPSSANNQDYRSIFRKVIDMGSVIAGANTVAHGVVVDINFTLIDLWVSGTNSVAFTGGTYAAPEVTYDATNIIFNSPLAYDRAFAFFEYCQEV